jgi:FtsH-binding integral membrane protein
MEENRKIIVINGLVFTFLMMCITLAVVASNPWDKLRGFGVGAVIGVGAAILLCLYALRSLDPVNLRPKNNPTNNYCLGCLLPITAISSVIVGRLLSSYFASSLWDAFVGCILTTATLTLVFLASWAWWHRPRNLP